MRKKTWLIIGGLVLAFVLVMANRGNKVDWTPSFDDSGTRPLDTKIFYEQLPVWFKDLSIDKVYTTFYEYDPEARAENSVRPVNYLCVSARYDIDETSFHSLLDYVADGNQAFVSAYTFPPFMKDTLNFEIQYAPVELKQKERTLRLRFAPDTLRYLPKLPFAPGYVKDTLNIKKLGHWITEDGEERTNFVGLPYGKGIFYIHTSPGVFTNYQMLEAPDTRYVSTVVSYLPENPILFDRAVKIDPEISRSPLRYILSRPALKWAWYLMLAAMGLFLLFTAKRKQRIIPLVEPPKNSTTDFVRTVSTLHYEAQGYNGIVQKAILHFLEFVRSTYHLDTQRLDANFVQRLARKSGKPQGEVQSLVDLVVRMRAHVFSTQEPLVELNKALERFYDKQL